MNMDLNSVRSLVHKLDDVSSVDCTNHVLSLIVDASYTIKNFTLFVKYWSDLYGTGLKIQETNDNNIPESFDAIYDAAMDILMGR